MFGRPSLSIQHDQRKVNKKRKRAYERKIPYEKMERDNEKSYDCGICGDTLPTRNQLILHVAAHRKTELRVVLEKPVPSTSGTKPKETPRRSNRVKNTRSETIMVSTRSIPEVKKTVAKTTRKDRKLPPVVDITGDDESNVKTVMSEETLLKAINEMKMKLQEDLTHKLTEVQKVVIASVTKNLQGELQKRWIEEENRESRRQEIRDLLTHFREEKRMKMKNAEPYSETSPRLIRRAEETIVITHRQPKDGKHERNTDLSAIGEPDEEPEAGPQDPRARQVEENRNDESVEVPKSPVQIEESGEEESQEDESSVENSKSNDLPQHIIGASSTDEEEE